MHEMRWYKEKGQITFGFLLLGIILGSLIAAGYFNFFVAQRPTDEKTEKSSVSLEKQYPFLSKRILQEFPNDILINFLDLRKQLRETVAPWEDTFGFYFEYLPTGTTIGVNEKDEFTAASLLKVPIVMGYYHQRERLHIRDDLIVTLTEDMVSKEFGDLWKRGVGAKISIGEAVKLALTRSDNTAARLVSSQTSYDDFNAVSEGLDIELKSKEATPIITLKQYSSILKALFFASIINKEDSEKILNLLSQTIFNDKLPAGVGQGVSVSHKIGVLDGKLYTDCGIVYVPRKPYILCMVSASSEDEARIRMIDTSSQVYKFVSSRE
jgi:beta-lactamase class A